MTPSTDLRRHQFAIGFSMLCVAVGVATGVAWLLGAL